MAELLTLPGVARKTANIILANAHPEAYATDPDAGIAVDTHVTRLSGLLGLSASTDPVKIERDLMAVVPRNEWFQPHLSPHRARAGGVHRKTAALRRVRAAGYLPFGLPGVTRFG